VAEVLALLVKMHQPLMAATVEMERHLRFLDHHSLMLEVVVGVVILQGMLALEVLVVVQMAVLLLLALTHRTILVAAAVAVVERQHQTAAQAALASSSLNTSHLHNPYSHSKVQPSG
jgi:hypothetical protein